MTTTFQCHESRADYERALTGADAPIPVWTGPRPDLRAAVTLAEDVYLGGEAPTPADVGVIVGDVDPALVHAAAAGLARAWLDLEALADAVTRTPGARVLVVGLYPDMTLRRLDRLLSAAYVDPSLRLGFLAGRDVHALTWMIAKQRARPRHPAARSAIFSAVDKPEVGDGVVAMSEDDFERVPLVPFVLGEVWKSVVFQGHGKDDSINLGDFTICGRSEAPAVPGAQRPRCGYGRPCYKDEAGLIPIRSVRAAEVVLSACNAGPLADLALYDPKYVVLLGALDGCARTVISSVSVHDSDRPENALWVAQQAEPGACLTPSLNESLRWQHPYVAFWHFGMPPTQPAPRRPPEQLDERIRGVVERVQAYLLADHLLPPRSPLRERLEKLHHKLTLGLARGSRDQRGAAPAAFVRTVADDLQSLDHSLAGQIQAEPELPLMSYPAYFGDRALLDPESARRVACACGNQAFEFSRRGLTAGVPRVWSTYCLRCGDRAFRVDGGPRLECRAAAQLRPGEPLEVTVEVAAARRGPVQVGLFVPSYLRADAAIEPGVQRIRQAGDGATALAFRVVFQPSVAPQAYYFTAFAVQDLAVSTCRQHFGIHAPGGEG